MHRDNYTDVIMTAADSYDMDKGHNNRSKNVPRREAILVWAAAIFFCIAILFTVIFAIYYIKYEDVKDKAPPVRTTTDCVITAPPVCTTTDCVITANVYTQTMNPEADPCENFAEYVCGQFYKDTVIPDDRQYVQVFLDIMDENRIMFRRLLEEDVKTDDHEFVKKMKGFYGECMDEAQIEKTGMGSYLADHKSDWPTLNAAWNESSFDLNSLLEKYERLFTHGIFAYVIQSNYTDSTQNVFMLRQPYLGLSSSQMMLARNDSHIMAYQQLYVDMAVALGADMATASQDAKDVVDFEVDLAKIFVTRTEESDTTILSNPIRLKDMPNSHIDWPRVVQAIYISMNVTIDPGQMVNIKHLKYFDNLRGVLDRVGGRVIQNRVAFEYAHLYLPKITKSLREVVFNFQKVAQGFKQQKPRWSQCVGMVDNIFGMGLSKVFVSRTFSQTSKIYMEKMIGYIKSSFEEMLNETDWMGEHTKRRAHWKLGNMTDKIGYPDKDFSNGDLDMKYENYTVVPGNFHSTYVDTRMQHTRENLKKLFQPYDPSAWVMTPNVVNAFYQRSANSINFPAGILQPIIFSHKYPSSINFGAIGAIVGHEITHGFDKTGSQYDETGTVSNWWQATDRKEYEERIKCLVNQYSSYKVEQVGLYIDGNRTLVENMADNGGIKVAFRAYKKFAATQKKESPLPGLGLTPEQQFFIATARYHCFQMTDAAMKIQVLARPHSPSRFRIIGNVQNSEDFARAFNCPEGSPMNPVKKCHVW